MSDENVRAGVGPEWFEDSIRRWGTSLPPRRSPKVSGRWIYVTPSLAKSWLDHRRDPEHQRRIRVNRVARIAEQMRNGTWNEATPQFICFDESGKNADGQHRLEAIVETGLSFWFMVAWAVPQDARKNIDTHARRSAAENLALSGNRGLFCGLNENLVQAIARCFVQGATLTKPQMEAGELERVIVSWRGGIHFALNLWNEFPSKKSGLNRSMVCALLARAFYHVDVNDHARMRAFLTVLFSGEPQDVDRDQAVIPYRDWLRGMARSNSNANADVYLRGCSALLAFLRGERRKLNRPMLEDPFPLPEPHHVESGDAASGITAGHPIALDFSDGSIGSAH